MNYEKIRDQAKKLHDKARGYTGSVRHNGKVYGLRFDSYQGHFEVSDDSGEIILRLNTRKPADAKKMFLKYMSN